MDWADWHPQEPWTGQMDLLWGLPSLPKLAVRVNGIGREAVARVETLAEVGTVELISLHSPIIHQIQIHY